MPDAKQRWRVGFARDERARGDGLRDAQAAWVACLSAAGLPLATTGARDRPLLALAASIPADADVEHDLAEVFLGERLTAAEARERIAAALPAGYRLVALDDEWIGAPSLASRLAAADWWAAVADAERRGRATVEACVRRLLEAEKLPYLRGRDGADGRVTDLRATIVTLAVAGWDEDAGRGELAMRLRHDQVVGAGRPGDVIDALELGLRPLALLRRRLWIADEVDCGRRAGDRVSEPAPAPSVDRPVGGPATSRPRRR